MSGERNGLARSRNDGNKWNIVGWGTRGSETKLGTLAVAWVGPRAGLDAPS